jgi:hypothetical protein
MRILLATLGRLADFELFGWLMDAVKVFLNYLLQNTGEPCERRRSSRNRLILVITTNSAATGAPSGHRAQGFWARQIDAGDTDDGLPRSFLVGAIVEVWVAHRLNWACELPLSRGEELP